ncbi:MAG: hypothetical protein HYY01_06985 [Chloroflexi bacterium]|nr:hypothetical protein [Chloroflexota bacterium]
MSRGLAATAGGASAGAEEYMGKKKRWPTEILYLVLRSLKDEPGLRKTDIGFRVALNGSHMGRWLRYMERVQLIMVDGGYYQLTGKGARVLEVLDQLFEELGGTDIDDPDSSLPVSMLFRQRAPPRLWDGRPRKGTT